MDSSYSALPEVAADLIPQVQQHQSSETNGDAIEKEINFGDGHTLDEGEKPSGDGNNNILEGMLNSVNVRENEEIKDIGMESVVLENGENANVLDTPVVEGPLLQGEPGADVSKQTEELLTSFSRSTSGSRTQRPFMQPKPRNFFDDWPVPVLYLPQDKPTGFNLAKFVTAGVTSNLNALGVEELECKEHVETWLAQRQQRRWTQSIRRRKIEGPADHTSDPSTSADSHPCLQAMNKFIGDANAASPTIEKSGVLKGFDSIFGSIPADNADVSARASLSKPNSSLLRLSGDSNREQGEFLTKLEGVRSHMNNATCTLLQASNIMLLPYLKLASGHQLDSIGCQTFVEEWVQIAISAAVELKPDSPNEAKAMISREFRSLRKESKKLYKSLKSLRKKIEKLFGESDTTCQYALERLNPKSLHSSKRREWETGSSADKRILYPETIHLSPVSLPKANISITELLKNHVFLSKSLKGSLIFKKEIDDIWESFAELGYNERRELFLSVTEDLHWTMKIAAATVNLIYGLFVDGYPESILSKLMESLTFLKKVAKQDDLLVLSKVTIVTQVNCLRESMSRLLRCLNDAKAISKYFYKNIKTSTYIPIGKREVSVRKPRTESKKNVSVPDSLSPNSLFSETFASLQADKSRIKLLVPFPISTDPIEDQFFMSSV